MILITSFVIIIVLYFLVSYCLFSVGLYKMAKKKGLPKPALAWVPVYNLYMVGLVAGDHIEIFDKRINNLSIIYLLGGLIFNGVILKGNTLSYGIIAPLFIVIHFLTLKKIFKEFNVSNPVLISTIAVIFSFTLPIIIFIVSFNEYGDMYTTIE